MHHHIPHVAGISTSNDAIGHQELYRERESIPLLYALIWFIPRIQLVDLCTLIRTGKGRGTVYK